MTKNKLQITVKQASPDGEQPGYDLFTVWQEYEEIAMHFNDLLLKIRTQSLAAVATFATVAGVLLKDASISHELRWGTLAAVFISLGVFWVAIWILDFTYYNRLLLGAVKALIEIEKESETSNRTSRIKVSTYIEQAVALREPATREAVSLSKGRWIFYLSVFVLLLALTVLSIMQLQKPAPPQPSAAANAATSTPAARKQD